MGQMTIYLDDQLEAKVKSRAKMENMSYSRWISMKLTVILRDEWPQEILDLLGAWSEPPDEPFPSLDEIRTYQSEDLPRETL